MLAIVAATAFVALCVFVATHPTNHLDIAARDFFRPDREWGPLQMRVDLVVEGIKPLHMALLMALVGIGASVRQSTWHPAAYVAMTAFVAGALTVFVKVLIRRSDPYHEMTAVGGSFPSGHMVSVLVGFGIMLLVLREHPRWWEWAIVGLSGLVMGYALLVQAAHWLTDVVGGSLLAMTMLAVASVFRFRVKPHWTR